MLDFIDEHILPFVLALYDSVGYVGLAAAVAL
jgi:hypothetical protein